jgi:DNA-binding transcriptional LysR family regulator
MDIKSIDLNLLIVLDTLLRERNVTRAAKRLHLTQSATSSALNRLRKLFGDPLLVRTSHGMVPTPKALALQMPLGDAMRGVQSLFMVQESFDPKRIFESFVMVASDYIQVLLLPSLLQVLQHEAPGLDLIVRPPQGQLHRTELESGAIDLVIAPYEAPPSFYQKEFWREDFVSVVAAHHPLAQKMGPITLEEFTHWPHIEVSFSGDFRNSIDQRLADIGIRRRVALAVPSLGTAIDLLPKTLYIATLPRTLAARHGTQVHVLQSPIPPASFRLRIIWHERAHKSPLHTWMRRLLLEQTKLW